VQGWGGRSIGHSIGSAQGQKKGAREDALDDENCHNGLEQHAFSWGFENRDFSLKLASTIGAGP
jgi:hypothetical protein